MRCFALVIAIMLGSVLHAQDFRVKGHALEETVADFLRIEPAVNATVEECKSGPRTLSPDELKRLDPLVSKKNLKAAERGEIRESDRAYRIRCGSVEQNGSNATFTTGLGFREFMTQHELATVGGDRSGWKAVWHFSEGKLVALTLDYLGHYADLRDELSKKIGSKPKETPIPYHNAFGATWENPFAEWLTDKYHATVTEGRDPAQPTWTTSTIETREEYERRSKQQKRPSALD